MTRPAPSHYPMIIEWSPDDQAYVVTVPDLPGCVTHGRTPEHAARMAEEAIAGWLDVARQDGLPIPAPRRHLVAA